MNGRTVVVVEDDAAIRRGLVDALGFGGYRVVECDRGDRAVTLLASAEPDLVLLDVMLPGLDGFAVLEEVRRVHPGLPVIMVTARGAEDDRIRGLEGGADDYVVKPFSAGELLARVAAVLRRSAERPEPAAGLAVAGRAVRFDLREIAFEDGTVRSLSEKETQVLRYLAEATGRTISREELLQRVWGLDPRGLATRTVDMHVARLREKLGDDGRSDPVILTVRGKGYALAPGVRTVAP